MSSISILPPLAPVVDLVLEGWKTEAYSTKQNYTTTNPINIWSKRETVGVKCFDRVCRASQDWNIETYGSRGRDYVEAHSTMNDKHFQRWQYPSHSPDSRLSHNRNGSYRTPVGLASYYYSPYVALDKQQPNLTVEINPSGTVSEDNSKTPAPLDQVTSRSTPPQPPSSPSSHFILLPGPLPLPNDVLSPAIIRLQRLFPISPFSFRRTKRPPRYMPPDKLSNTCLSL